MLAHQGFKSLILLFLALALSSARFAHAQASTNLSDVYKYLNFNPLGTNCGVLLQISDIHMALDSAELAQGTIVTNIDPRLMTMVNALSPQPTALILTGDLCTAGAIAFGEPDNEPESSNELVYAKIALEQFTNFPVYILPGNHDNPAYEVTNTALFNSVFPDTPRYTNFTIAGLPVIGLAGHGGGWLDPQERNWLAGLREHLDHTKPVLLAVHQPIVSAVSSDARELRRDIEWFLKPWTAPTWIACGHQHTRDVTQWHIGLTTVTEYTCPSAQNWLIPTVNPQEATACGFYLWCITNGTVLGVIEGVLTNATYYDLGIEHSGQSLPHLYDGLTNILFTAEEGHFDRNEYHIARTGGWDVTYWWSYLTSYTCKLPTEKYTNATRVFFIGAPGDFNSHFFLGSNINSWVSVPLEFVSAGVAVVSIPPNLRSRPLWGMVSNTVDQMFLGGFGLATTNQMSDFAAWAGVTVGDSTISPMTILPDAGGIPAWDAYLYGLDASHTETLREPRGFPSIGSLPHVESGRVRFGGRTNLNYTVSVKTKSNIIPWVSVKPTISLTTNGWNEYQVTNSAPVGLFRIGANLK